MTNICSDDLAKSRDFYTKLFDFNVDYDSDWFVHLIPPFGVVSPTSYCDAKRRFDRAVVR